MNIFFNGWESLIRIFIIGVLGYISLVLILRISGPRTLSKMNSFDFIITIALGSTFSSALLQKSVTLADAVFAFALLVGLQYLVTYLNVRSQKFKKLTKGTPVILFSHGEFHDESLICSHVTKDEVLAGMREQGIQDLRDVSFILLETNGKIVALNA